MQTTLKGATLGNVIVNMPRIHTNNFGMYKMFLQTSTLKESNNPTLQKKLHIKEKKVKETFKITSKLIQKLVPLIKSFVD